MRVGVVIPAAEVDGHGSTPGWPAIRSFVSAAEAHGLDSVWMFDHFFNEPANGPIEGMHEGWTIVSALAAVTERRIAASPCSWRRSVRGCFGSPPVTRTPGTRRGTARRTQLREQLATFRAAVEAEDRDPATLTLTVGMTVYDSAHHVPEDDGEEDPFFSGSVDELSGAIDEYAALGIGHLIVLLQPLTEASLDRLALALGQRSGPI